MIGEKMAQPFADFFAGAAGEKESLTKSGGLGGESPHKKSSLALAMGLQSPLEALKTVP